MLVVAKLRLNPSCACLDFEKAFVSAGKDQFSKALIVGCFSLEASTTQAHEKFARAQGTNQNGNVPRMPTHANHDSN